MTTRGAGGAEGKAADPATEAGAELRLDRQLCFALYSASSRFTRLYRPLLEPLGLTYPQYLAMLVLWERAPRTVGEVGDALGLDSATLTPLLKRLEQAGHVQRRRDPADERRVLVTLTPEGAALRTQAVAMREQLQCLLPLPAGELASLHAMLGRLNASFDRREAGEEG